MDEFPKVGMKCEQVRSRLKKLKTAVQPEVKKSLINQARLHEGEGIVKELNKEFSGKNSRKHKTMGYKSRGNYSIGICYKGLNDCVNKDVSCDKCVRFSEYVPKGSE